MEEKKVINNEYRTNDLREATLLAFKGVPYDVDKSNPSRVFFIFTGVTDTIIQSLLSEFWSGSKEFKLLSTFRDIKKIAVFDGYKKNYYKNNDSNRK